MNLEPNLRVQEAPGSNPGTPTKTRTAEHRKVFGFRALRPTTSGQAIHSLPLLSPVWRTGKSNFTILIQTRIIRTRFRSKTGSDDALFVRNTAAGHNAPPPQRQQPQDKIKHINITSAGAAVLSVRPPSPPAKSDTPSLNLPAPPHRKTRAAQTMLGFPIRTKKKTNDNDSKRRIRICLTPIIPTGWWFPVPARPWTSSRWRRPTAMMHLHHLKNKGSGIWQTMTKHYLFKIIGPHIATYHEK